MKIRVGFVLYICLSMSCGGIRALAQWSQVYAAGSPAKFLYRSHSSTFAAFDDVGIVRSDDDGESWNLKNAGLTSTNINSMSQSRSGIIISSRNEVLYSSNNGDSWNSFGSAIPCNEIYSLSAFGTGSDTVYAGTDNGLYMTDGLGRNWTLAYSPSVSKHVTSVFASSRGGGYIYALVERNGILCSNDMGVNWEINDFAQNNETIQSFVVSGIGDPHPHADVWVVSDSGKAYCSTDNCHSWSRVFGTITPSSGEISDSIQNRHVVSLYVPPGTSAMMAGTKEGGVLISFTPKHGAKESFWIAHDIGAPNAGVLFITEAVQFVVAALDNGTIWRISGMQIFVITKNDDGGRMTSLPVLHSYPNPSKNDATIGIALPNKATVTLDVYNCLGMKMANIASGALSAGEHFFHLNMGGYPPGIYTCVLTEIGASRIQHLTLVK